MDEKTLQEIIHYLIDDLGGDWFLTGGSLVRLKFDQSRWTEDLDFVRIGHPKFSEPATKNELHQWLIKKGLGPEWINDAVEPFVRRVKDWEKEVVQIYSGKKGKIFRPNLTLFVYLKMGRASEVDLKDIAVVSPQCPEGFEEKKFKSWADEKIISTFDSVRSKLSL